MARPRKTENVDNKVTDISSLMAEMLQVAVKAGGTSYKAGEREEYITGIPIPNYALPLQFVIQNDIWPLHRLALIAGPFGSCKTTLALEICRWFIHAGGGINYLETEGKMDAMHIMAVIGSLINLVNMHEAQTVEEWQMRITESIEFLTSKPKGSITFPVVYLVDSLTGSDTQEALDHIKETGHAKGRTFSDMSLNLSQYFKWLSSAVLPVPVTGILINHQKRDLKQLPTGRSVEVKRKPGGDAQGFHATLDISVSKIGDINTVKRQGKKIGMQCEKNSMGVTGLKGYFETVASDRVDENGKMLRALWIDWYSSIPVFLRDCLKVDKVSALKDVLTISEAGNKWSCSQLGLVRATPSEFGKALVANDKLFKQVQDVLGIARREHKFLGPNGVIAPDPGPWFEEVESNVVIDFTKEEVSDDTTNRNTGGSAAGSTDEPGNECEDVQEPLQEADIRDPQPTEEAN